MFASEKVSINVSDNLSDGESIKNYINAIFS